jgi:thioredoxin 1
MHLHPERFESEVLASSEPVLVDFYTPRCVPCQQISPVIDALAQDYPVCKVNAEEWMDLAIRYRVTGVPTLVIVAEGKEVARFVGVQPERKLRQALDQALMK